MQRDRGPRRIESVKWNPFEVWPAIYRLCFVVGTPRRVADETRGTCNIFLMDRSTARAFKSYISVHLFILIIHVSIQGLRWSGVDLLFVPDDDETRNRKKQTKNIISSD